jgi:hypothetical protein
MLVGSVESVTAGVAPGIHTDLPRPVRLAESRAHNQPAAPPGALPPLFTCIALPFASPLSLSSVEPCRGPSPRRRSRERRFALATSQPTVQSLSALVLPVPNAHMI